MRPLQTVRRKQKRRKQPF